MAPASLPVLREAGAVQGQRAGGQIGPLLPISQDAKAGVIGQETRAFQRGRSASVINRTVRCSSTCCSSALGNRSGGGMPEKNHGPESLSSFFPHFAQAALRSTRHLESSVEASH